MRNDPSFTRQLDAPMHAEVVEALARLRKFGDDCVSPLANEIRGLIETVATAHQDALNDLQNSRIAERARAAELETLREEYQRLQKVHATPQLHLKASLLLEEIAVRLMEAHLRSGTPVPPAGRVMDEMLDKVFAIAETIRVRARNEG